MREIKFRIYDMREDYKFVTNDPGHFNLSADGDVFCVNEGYEITEHVKLMQFTGLKDKNGIEIYEGDVVNPGRADGKLIVVTIGEQEHHEDWGGIVIYQGCNLIISSGYPRGVKHDYEVVGNIYEHPHLLEVSTE